MNKVVMALIAVLFLVVAPITKANPLSVQQKPIVLAANPFEFLFNRDRNQRATHRNQRYNSRANRNYRYQQERRYRHNNYRRHDNYRSRQQQHYRDRRYDNNYRYQTQRRYWRGNGWYTEPGSRRHHYEQENYTTGKRHNSRVRYSTKICESGDYKCMKIKRGQSWKKLFPDEKKRDLVKRFNRTNMRLQAGQEIAIPPELESADLLDISPFDKEIESNGEKTILVDLSKQAFGAYNEDGDLVHWGPVSGGKNWCRDIGKPCNTIRGVFNVFHKKDARCRSRSFPVDRGGGSPMPYCMFFHKGFAMHGSYEVPGYNASHGCLRMYKADAKWLNEEFVETPAFEHDKGTRVIVLTTEEDTKEKATTSRVKTDDEWNYSEDYYDL